MAFLRACGLVHVAMLLCLLLASPLTNSFNDLWLTIWSSQTRGTKKGGSGASTSLANSVFAGWTSPDSPTTMYLRIYATFALASICILILGSTITVQVFLLTQICLICCSFISL